MKYRFMHSPDRFPTVLDILLILTCIKKLLLASSKERSVVGQNSSRKAGQGTPYVL
jgi:hypothetical protein